jgi:hypothetical protein
VPLPAARTTEANGTVVMDELWIGASETVSDSD